MEKKQMSLLEKLESREIINPNVEIEIPFELDGLKGTLYFTIKKISPIETINILNACGNGSDQQRFLVLSYERIKPHIVSIFFSQDGLENKESLTKTQQEELLSIIDVEVLATLINNYWLEAGKKKKLMLKQG